MRNTAIAATGLICVAAASFAATAALNEREPEVIEIEVSLDELQDCRETLAQVTQAPAVHDNGTPMLFGVSDDLPGVRCVVTEI